MYEQVAKSKESKGEAIANSMAQKKGNDIQGFGFVDNRPEAVTQRRLQERVENNPRMMHLKAVQRKESRTNLQDVNSSYVRSAKITVENNASTNTSVGVSQRIQADVSQNGRVRGSSPVIGRGGRGGVSHAEQQAWNAAGPPVVGAGDIINFMWMDRFAHCVQRGSKTLFIL